MNAFQNLAAPVGRVLLALMFLSVAGGLRLVLSHGAGPWSIDNRQRS